MYSKRYSYVRVSSLFCYAALLFLALTVLLSACSPSGGSALTGELVDLRAYQTQGFPSGSGSPSIIRNQGGRNTCITFAAIAALEAAYKRQYGLELDLSEEFTNYLGKVEWLRYERYGGDPAPADLSENQLAAWGGGGGTYYIKVLARGLAVPSESEMPYVSDAYLDDLEALCEGCSDFRNAYWTDQYNMDSFDLNPPFLPKAALTASSYYSVKSYQVITNPKDPAQIEDALRQGYEVVVDTYLANTSGSIWRPCDSGGDDCVSGSHAILIVGFNTTDPENPYFIVKNSWGGDWTYIDYEYATKYFYEASYITEVDEPHAWPELQILGRWDLSFDGHHGTLDIYHLPGIQDGFFNEQGFHRNDLRLGTFFDQNGNAYRVNGRIKGKHLTFYLDVDNPDLHFNELVGRRFDYYLFDDDIDSMAGFHLDEDGRRWSGYARRCTAASWPNCGTSYLPVSYDTPRPLAPESLIGRWAISVDGYEGELLIRERDDFRLPIPDRGTYAGMVGEYTPVGGTMSELVVGVLLDDPAEIKLTIDRPGDTSVDGSPQKLILVGRHLSHESGVIAGTHAPVSANSGKTGFYAYRIGPALVAKIVSPSQISLSRARDELFEVRVTHDPLVSCCTYEWNSSQDGPFGDEESFLVPGQVFSPGEHIITVNVTDALGNSSSDSIVVSAPENVPPTVKIILPVGGTTFQQSQQINLAGTSSDIDHPPHLRLDEAEVAWYLDNRPMSFATGHNATLTGLSLGEHTVTFLGTDGQAEASDSIVITIVEDGANQRPEARIISPDHNALFYTDGYDPARDQYYAELTFSGQGLDPEDGELGDSSLEWIATQEDGEIIHLGRGRNPTARLYVTGCASPKYKISLIATDSSGTTSAPYSIEITVSVFC